MALIAIKFYDCIYNQNPHPNNDIYKFSLA